VGDPFHDSAVDLFDAGLPIDDDIIEIAREQADDLFQIGVHLAVAAGGLRTADGEKGEAVLFHNRVKDAEPGFPEHLDGLPGLAGFNVMYDGLADIVKRFFGADAQRDGQPDRGVRVDRQDARAGFLFRQKANDAGGNRGLPDPALTRNGNDGTASLHTLISPCIWSRF
jgi:hypothetical protein